jgi:hypothetical protein
MRWIAIFIWNIFLCCLFAICMISKFIWKVYVCCLFEMCMLSWLIWDVYDCWLIDWLVFNANVSSISAISWLVIVEIRSSSYNIAYNNLTNKMKICKCKEILHVGCRNKMKKAPHFTSFAQGLLSKVAGIN